jgi:hypothetical protein
VVQNSVFIRRQQKVSILALLAALGSFATGVMLPWNLRVSRALPPIPSSDPSEEVLTPPTPSQPVEEEKQSPRF